MAVNANIGTAWISVVPDTDKLAPAIKDALKDAEKSAVGSGSNMGQGLTSGINKTLKAGVVGAGLAAGGVLAASITKGLGRLSGIDNAQAKLSGLGHEAAAVEGIMDDALASVKGTAFGLEDAATIAASAVAAGIDPGKDLQRTLKLTGDAATIAGTDLSTMGSIVNKVATSDMMQMDVANQMMDAGIPILQMVGEELGVTAEEARKMASDGEISFETFQSALENGLGGAALKSGDTVQGAFANMQAAAGRFGAQLAAPVFNAAPEIFGAMGGAFDQLGEKLEPLIADFADWLAPRMEAFATETIPKLVDGVMGAVDAFIEFGGWVKDNAEWIKPLAAGIGGAVAAIYAWNTATTIAKGIQLAFNAVLAVNPIMLIVTALAAVAAGLVYFFTQTETGKEVWSKFTTALSDGWQWVQDKVGGGVDWLTEKFTSFTDWLSRAVDVVKQAFGDFMSIFRKEDYDSSGIMMLLGGNQEWHDRIVGFAEKLAWVGDAIKGFWDLLTTGDADTSGIMAIFGPEWHERITGFVDTVRGAISKAGEIITAVFDRILYAAQVTIGVIGAIVLAPFLITWNALSWAISAGYENIIKPTWDLMASAAMWLWENGIKPVLESISEKWDLLQLLIGKAIFEIRLKIYEFQTAITALWLEYVQPVLDAIRSKWDQLSAAMTATWNVIKTAVFDAWNWYVNQVKANWDTVTNALNAAWTALKDHFTSIWNTIKTSVLDAWNTAVNFLRDTFDTITTTISDKWSWLRDQLSSVYGWIKENVFDAMGRGLDTLKDWFQTGVDGIARIWDGLKAAAAKPARFVVDTVWNNGILAAWNSISKFLPGIDAKDKIPLGDLGGYASGGVLPGYTPGRDVHEFHSPTGGRIHLSGGEAIMRPEWTRAVGGPGAVERMNRDAKTGKLRNASGHGPSGLWDLGEFAGGGVIGAMMNIVRAKYGNILTMTSGQRPGGGMHGAGLATDWSNGSGNTPAQLALAHDIAQTYPGSAELIYDSPGWSGNLKNGQNVGPFGQYYTMAQAGRHDHHVHWGMTTPPTMQFGGGVFEGGSNGGGIGAAIVNWIADKARSIWSSVVDPIKDKIGGKAKDWEGSSFGEIPGAMFTSLGDAAWSRLSSLFGSGGGSDSGSVDTSNVPGDVVGAVETVFARHGFTGAEWEAAKWIIQKESNWSPTAQNPSSGAYGLFQFNPMGGNTLGAYLPDRNTDPAVQADAGARYIKDRYGTPSAAKRFWEQNQWYANGGVIPSGMGLFDTGGVWKSGTMGMNLSGKNEYVFTNRAMRDFQQATESLQVVAEEIGAAFNGGDWGMGELASYIGVDLAESIINGAAALGEISRTIGEQAQKSGTDYATTQATDALDVMGLGGLVPLGQKLGAKAWDMYQASPYEVGFNGQSVTVEIEAESDADLIRVAEFKRLADQVHGLEVKVTEKKKPLAAAVTRGGAM